MEGVSETETNQVQPVLTSNGLMQTTVFGNMTIYLIFLFILHLSYWVIQRCIYKMDLANSGSKIFTSCNSPYRALEINWNINRYLSSGNMYCIIDSTYFGWSRTWYKQDNIWYQHRVAEFTLFGKNSLWMAYFLLFLHNKGGIGENISTLKKLHTSSLNYSYSHRCEVTNWT